MGGELLAFFAVSALVILTPGQDTALTIRNTLAGGRRSGVGTALGVSTGQAAWTLAASAGLGRSHGPVARARAGGLAPAAAFRQGMISNLGNPKMAVFFTSLLPQFAPAGGASFPVMLGLGLVFCTMTLAWLSAYSVAVDRAGDVLRRPAVRRVLDAVTGTVLVALGLRLATHQR